MFVAKWRSPRYAITQRRPFCGRPAVGAERLASSARPGQAVLGRQPRVERPLPRQVRRRADETAPQRPVEVDRRVVGPAGPRCLRHLVEALDRLRLGGVHLGRCRQLLAAEQSSSAEPEATTAEPARESERTRRCPRCQTPMTRISQDERLSWREVLNGSHRPPWYDPFHDSIQWGCVHGYGEPPDG